MGVGVPPAFDLPEGSRGGPRGQHVSSEGYCRCSDLADADLRLATLPLDRQAPAGAHQVDEGDVVGDAASTTCAPQAPVARR